MTRPRQHNAIEVFTLPLGFTKLSRLRVLFKDSCNLSVFWSPPETLEVPLWTQLVLKRATLLENFMSAQKWSLDTSSKWLQSWNLVSKPHCALSVLQLNQLKVCCLNFSAKVSRQEAAEREKAAQINFWKVHCPALLCRDGWKTRTPLLLPTKLLLPSKRIKLFPFSVCRGKLSCSKMTGNDCDASSRAQPQLLRTWHFLWILQLCTLVHLAKDVKWIVCANVIPWYGNRETKQNFIVSRSPIVARFLIVVLGDDKLYSNIWVDRVIPKHFNHMTFFSVRLM